MMHNYLFLSIDGQGSLGGRSSHPLLHYGHLMRGAGNPTQGKDSRASKSNTSFARIIRCPLSLCLLFPHHVSVLAAMDTLVMKQRSISPACATWQAQLLSYQWKNRFDIKDPCKGNRRCHYTAATKQSLLCRALCLQEPSKKHSSVTPSHNPVHALIQVETEQHIKGCRRATIMTNHLGTELRSSQPKTTNDNTPWPAKSNPCTKGVEQLLSPLNRPERDWWLASTCLIKNRWKYIIALIVSA